MTSSLTFLVSFYGILRSFWFGWWMLLRQYSWRINTFANASTLLCAGPSQFYITQTVMVMMWYLVLYHRCSNYLPNWKIPTYLTIEGASTILVYGKHFFLYNFSLATILETICYLNWTYLQKENMIKIQAHSTKPFSRYETCPLANVTLFDGTKSHFCPSNITFTWKTLFCL